MKTTQRGEFLDRLESDLTRRKDSVERIASNLQQFVSNKANFQPKINKQSAKLPKRSTYEMSRGDLLRKETNHRMTRLKLEQEQANELTFQPELSHKAELEGKSVIKQVTESNQVFIDWYKEKQERLEEKRKQSLAERNQKELANCTFTPKTKECPSYIKRIAKSMAVVKAIQPTATSGSDDKNSKPDWK